MESVCWKCDKTHPISENKSKPWSSTQAPVIEERGWCVCGRTLDDHKIMGEPQPRCPVSA